MYIHYLTYSYNQNTRIYISLGFFLLQFRLFVLQYEYKFKNLDLNYNQKG